MLIVMLYPLTSFSPMTGQEPKQNNIVLNDSIPEKVYPISDDGLIDLGPIIEPNKKIDNLILIMKERESDTIKKD
jgi:hypothetical protein